MHTTVLHFGHALRAMLTARALTYRIASDRLDKGERTIARYCANQKWDGPKSSLIEFAKMCHLVQPLTAEERRILGTVLGPALSQIDAPTDAQRLISLIAEVPTLEILGRLINRHGEDTVRGILWGIELAGNIFNVAPAPGTITEPAMDAAVAASAIKPPPGSVAHRVHHADATVTVIEPAATPPGGRVSNPTSKPKRRTSN